MSSIRRRPSSEDRRSSKLADLVLRNNLPEARRLAEEIRRKDEERRRTAPERK